MSDDVRIHRSKTTDRATWRLFWQAGLRQPRLLAGMALFPVGAICLNMLNALFVGKILGALAGGAPVKGYLISFVIVTAIGVLCNRFGFAWLLAHQAHTMSYLQQRGMQALLQRSVGFHNNNVGGKLVSDAIDLQQGYSLVAGAVYNNIIPFGLTLLIGTTIVFFESWIFGLIILTMTSYALISGYFDSRRREPIRRERLRATKAVTGHIADTILNVFTVKTFAREDREMARHQELNEALRDRRVSDWYDAAYTGNTRYAILLVMQIGFVLTIIHLVQNDPGLLGIGIFAFSFTIMLSSRLFEINAMLRSIEDGLLQASPMVEIMQETPEVQDKPGATTLTVPHGAIDLQDVVFRYADANQHETVFNALTLHIKPGEKVGLVGPSGGGKSTFTRLLLRFEDINNGSICIDGQDITAVTQASLREAIAYVPQEPLLFHRTVRENIAYGLPGADDKAVERAARSAHAHTFIQALQHGYDTIVGERGVKLSGGQRQRIAIARAILKNAPILVLDEATSALDSESEVYIQQALWKLMQKRTALVIAHRLSTIQKMDRIIVLEGGRIAEEGTHSQLLRQKGVYAKLWAHQSGGFIEEDTTSQPTP